jgi:hypothetical protein
MRRPCTLALLPLLAILVASCGTGEPYLEQTALRITSPTELEVLFSEALLEYDASSWFAITDNAQPDSTDTLTNHAIVPGGRGIRLTLIDSLAIGHTYTLDYLLNCKIDGISSASSTGDPSKMSAQMSTQFAALVVDSVLTAQLVE